MLLSSHFHVTVSNFTFAVLPASFMYSLHLLKHANGPLCIAGGISGVALFIHK